MKIGSKVQHITGGPTMAIGKIQVVLPIDLGDDMDPPINSVVCHWWDRDFRAFQSFEFHPSELIEVV